MTNKTHSVDIIGIGCGSNHYGWPLLEQALIANGYSFRFFSKHSDVDITCKLGILLGYDRIVGQETLDKAELGFVVFHSSDLPNMRGWAPIYNTMVQNRPLVQSLLWVDKEVDAGNLIAKAHYPLEGNELEAEVRAIDDLLTETLFRSAIPKLLEGNIVGKPQPNGEETWCPRRKPDDSIISVDSTVAEIFDHIRALPENAPAFFEHKGRKYTLTLAADTPVSIEQTKVILECFYPS